MPLGKPARPMPIPESVREYLGDLLGRSVEVDKRRRDLDIDGEDAPSLVTVTYVDDVGVTRGACLAELPLAGTCGAALAMMPAGAVTDAVKADRLSETLAENWFEVANVLSRLLNGPAVSHLRVGALHVGVPDDVRTLTDGAAVRRTFTVTVMGYPGGSLAFYAG